MEARNDNAIPLIIPVSARKKNMEHSRVVSLLPGSLFRRWGRPTVFGYLDGRSPDEIERLDVRRSRQGGRNATTKLLAIYTSLDRITQSAPLLSLIGPVINRRCLGEAMFRDSRVYTRTNRAMCVNVILEEKLND